MGARDDTVIEKNEGGWGRTRATRRKDLDDIVEKVRAVLCADDAADTVKGVVLVILNMEDGVPRAHQAAIAYGVEGLALLVGAADNALANVGETIVRAEQARAESRVRGKRHDH